MLRRRGLNPRSLPQPAGRLLLAAAVCFPAIAGPATAQAAGDEPADGFEGVAEVIEVEVPIQVVDRDGEPVRGLTAEDFTILDNGKPQEIAAFRVVDLELIEPGETRTEIERAVPATGRRHFLLLFDLSFSAPHAVLRAREAARDFVLHRLHPTDLVAVATHTIESGAQLLVTFTPDRAQVARAIDTLGAPKLLQLARRDPLQFLLEDPGLPDFEASRDLDQSEQGDGPGAALRESVLAHLQVIGNEMAKVEKSFQRGRVSSWSRSMAELARYLDSVKGRKHVVYFSEGFDGRLLFGRQPSADDRDTQEDLFNISTGQLHLVDTDNLYGNTLLQSDMLAMLEEFRRADCVVEAVDIGGLRADSPGDERTRDVGQDALFYIAHETGGNLYKDANDFGTQLARVLARSSVTYLVTFRPSTIAYDGSFHRLRVRVDTERPTRVVAREGYYAPRPWEELHPFEKSLIASNAIASATAEAAVGVKVLAASFRAAPGLGYVPVIVEVDGASLLGDLEGTRLPIELYTYATDEKGEMRDFFTQLVTLDLTTTREAFARAGFKYYGHLELPRGSYLLRVLVRNGATGASGLAAVPVEIPAYDRTEPVLLPPFFVEDGRGWLMAREELPEFERTVVYPFTVNGEPYVPAVHPRLTQGDEAIFCVVAYNVGEQTRLEGRVVGEDGALIARVDLSEAERTVTGIEGVDKFLATFSPDGLGRGNYTFQVSLIDRRTGAERVNSAPFSIH